MAFPRTLEEMAKMGYSHQGSGQCRSCSEPLDWWSTPKGKKIPMDRGTATPHWTTCPNAENFRRPRVERRTFGGYRGR